MMIVLQVFFVLFAIALAWEAIKGFRGVPNKQGKQTGTAMAVILCVFALGLVASAFLVLPGLLR